MKASETSGWNLFAAGLAYLVYSWSSAFMQAPANYALTSARITLPLPAGVYAYVEQLPTKSGGSDFGASAEGPAAVGSLWLAPEVLVSQQIVPTAVARVEEWRYDPERAWRPLPSDWSEYPEARPEPSDVPEGAVATIRREPSDLSSSQVIAYYKTPPRTTSSFEDASVPVVSVAYSTPTEGVGSILGSGMTPAMLAMRTEEKTEPVPEPATLGVLAVGAGWLLRCRRSRKTP